MSFTIHTPATAPAGSRPLLEKVRASLGFVPNLYGVLAESPAALEAALGLTEAYARSGLSAAEQQVVLLATSTENDCEYCVAAHTVIAAAQRVPTDVVQAVRNGSPIASPKLEALRRFTTAVVRERGRVPENDVAAFLAAGYTRAQLLGVLLGVTIKIQSNYLNHIAHTPLDAAFQPHAWNRAAA